MIQFKYDYLGRRIRKTVSNWSGSAYVAALDRKFLYNGWNLIGEYDAGTSPLVLVTSYVWGLDLSGNLVDGGGVGGLLAIRDVANSAWHLPYYDANGNLHALVDRATGTVTAAYEYSPFGETLRVMGAYAATNTFRFSTKYTDAETQLLYYGYRYYNPSLGRWLGRDPLGERGGLHLYAFCRNNAVNAYDGLGQYAINEIFGGIPDDDVFSGLHPTFVKQDGGWYDPGTDVLHVFREGSDPAYGQDDSSERFEVGPLGGTINPSLLQQINSTFAWSASFTQQVIVAEINAVREGTVTIKPFTSMLDSTTTKKATPAGNPGTGMPGPGALAGATAMEVGKQLLQGAKQNLQFVDNNILKPLNTIFDATLNAAGWFGDQVASGFGEGVKNGLLVGSMFIGGGEGRLVYGAAEANATRASWIGEADGLAAARASGAAVLELSSQAQAALAVGNPTLMIEESAAWARGATGDTAQVFYGTGAGRTFRTTKFPELMKNLDSGILGQIEITF